MWSREGARGTTQTIDAVNPASATAVKPTVEPKPRVGERSTVVARIGKSVVIVGDVVASEDLIVDGQVKGRVEVNGHQLTVGPNAQIEAAIVARAVTIEGNVIGDVTATEKIEIRETGSVDGNLTAPRVAILAGAYVRGRVDTEWGKMSSINDDVERTRRFASSSTSATSATSSNSTTSFTPVAVAI